MSKAVMQLALDALEEILEYCQKEEWRGGVENGGYVSVGSALLKGIITCDRAITELESELAKPEPEPVAWMRPSEEGYDSAFRDNSTIVECPEGNWAGWFPLYRKEDL